MLGGLSCEAYGVRSERGYSKYGHAPQIEMWTFID